MSDPFLAEIVMFAGNFNPRGWAFCEGQLLPISQNTALFSLLGTTFGGDGRVTFQLPDQLHRCRIPNAQNRIEMSRNHSLTIGCKPETVICDGCSRRRTSYFLPGTRCQQHDRVTAVADGEQLTVRRKFHGRLQSFGIDSEHLGPIVH